MTALALHGGQPTVVAPPERCWPFWSEDATREVQRLINTNRTYTIGGHEAIGTLERNFAALLTPDQPVMFCDSGTAALYAAYLSSGLDPGAEVLAPTFTFRATVTPLLLAGLRPVLVDVDPSTGGINLEDAAARVTSRTQGLVVTHWWGHPVDLDAVLRFSQEHNIVLFEDCSHGHGAVWGGRQIGTIGDAAAWSLGTTKLVSGGLGGMLATRHTEMYERALLLGQPKHRALREIHGLRHQELAGTGLGANLRGSPLHAVLAADHLSRLQHTVTLKNANLSNLAALLIEHLPQLLPIPRSPGWTAGTWYKLPALWSHPAIPRDTLVAALRAEGVDVRAPIRPLHHEPLFTTRRLHDDGVLSSLPIEPLPLADPHTYPHADSLADRVVEWSTRELYEPAQGILHQYGEALAKVARNLDQLAVYPPIPSS